MHPRLLAALSPLLLPLAVAVVPPAASAAPTPQPPDCPLWSAHESVDHPFTTASGQKLVARDPYGGLLARNRLFFSFSVRAADGSAPSGVKEVAWSLDGEAKRTDDTAPYQWSGLSGSDARIPAGDHTVTVTVTPADGGAPATTSFRLAATDCQPAATFSQIGIGSKTLFSATSSYESSDGPTLRGVAFSGTGLRASVRRADRGRVAGMLLLDGARTGPTLRIPRRGSRLLLKGSLRVTLHPGAKTFLTVTGLPAGTHEATVQLTGAGRRLVAVTNCRRFGADAVVKGARRSVSLSGGSSRSC